MDFESFVQYLHSGAFSSFKNLVSCLSNADIKTLRLSLKSLSEPLYPFLFRRIYLSAHDTDLEVFKGVALDDRSRFYVNEIVWDDTTFDRWITGLETYTDRLLSVTPLPSHVLKQEKAAITEAYRFWASEATVFAKNRQENVDRKILEESISLFPNLRQITLMSRSRLTYVDNEAYWDLWQTPRSINWKSKPFFRHLLQPEPYKPSVGTTVPQSEGIRPIAILLEMTRGNFKLGALVVNLIGGGQTRTSGGMNGNRYQRQWLIDLPKLTEARNSTMSSGRISLNLLIEQQTEDIFRQQNMWEELVDQTLEASADTLEELTISNICMDWFWEYQQSHLGRMLENCRTLRRLNMEGGWCQNPAELLKFVRTSTPVREVSISFMDAEGVSWYDILQDLRRSKIAFDYFDIHASRCPSELYPWQADSSWAAPWYGPSNKVVAWLQDQTEEIPLSQGPG